MSPLERRERDKAATRALQAQRERSALVRITRKGVTATELHDRLLLVGALTGGSPLDVTRRTLASLAEQGHVHELAGVYYPGAAPSQGPRTGAPALGDEGATGAPPAPGATAGSEPSAAADAAPAGEPALDAHVVPGGCAPTRTTGDEGHGATAGATEGAAPLRVGDESPGRVAAPEGVLAGVAGEDPAHPDEPPAAPAGVTEPSCSERAPLPLPPSSPEPPVSNSRKTRAPGVAELEAHLAAHPDGTSYNNAARALGCSPSHVRQLVGRSEGQIAAHAGPYTILLRLVSSSPSPASSPGVAEPASGGDLAWTAPAWLAEALDLDDGDPAGREEVEAALRNYAPPRRDPDDLVCRVAQALGMGAPASATADRVIEEATALAAALQGRRTELDDARARAERYLGSNRLLEQDVSALRGVLSGVCDALDVGTNASALVAAQDAGLRLADLRAQVEEAQAERDEAQAVRDRARARIHQLEHDVAALADAREEQGALRRQVAELQREGREIDDARGAALLERDRALDDLRLVQAQCNEFHVRLTEERRKGPQYFVAVDYGDRPDLDLLDELRSRAAASGLRPPLRGGHAAFIAYLTGWLEREGTITAPPEERPAVRLHDEEGPCPA